MEAIRVSSDVIVYTFSFLEAGLRLKANKAEICKFFYKMSQENKFKDLLEVLVFDTTSCYPYSDSVFEAIDRLTGSSFVSTIDLEVYEITEALTEKDVGEIFSGEECELLKELAERFSIGIEAYFPSWHNKYKS
ncbi:MAG: hypothetical protein ACE5F2_02375 [Candidatus Paceibacteria bacterium]